MERDNLTDVLNHWKEKDVDAKQLSAPRLYRDLMADWADSESMMDTATNFIQMIQGKMYCMAKLLIPINIIIPIITRLQLINEIFL